MSFPGTLFLRFIGLLLCLLQFLPPVVAQKFNLQSINPVRLEKLASEQNLQYQRNKSRVETLARKPHWFISETTPDGRHLLLQGISETGKPIYYTTFNNISSSITTNTNRVWTGGTAGLQLSGSSPLLAGKLGIWDGGAVLPSHQEFQGRIVSRDGSTLWNDHATHVAGTMIAAGINALAKGMAYQAPDLQAWYFDNDNAEIAAAAGSLLLSNHSYGHSSGWLFSGNQWYWLGNPQISTRDDVYFGYYDYYAQLWDDIAYQAPYYLIVKAVGNSRHMSEPAVGTPFLWLNPATGAWDLNKQGRSANMRSYTGYDVIPDHSVAKNILSVGAVSPLPKGYAHPAEVESYIASSWGPTDDGRIKPDLVASGIRVLSTVAGANNAYQEATGTSMAAPNVTGSLLLLQEHHANLKGGSFMRAATLKGLAIHTAQEAGAYPGPDYVFGWGLLNTEEAARVLTNSGGKDLVNERILKQDSTYTRSITAAGTSPLKVTICWTDPKGTILPLKDSTSLNNRTPMLVNDLDISLSGSNNTFLPWTLDPANPAAPATTGNNFRDNVEQILIPDPAPGTTYTLTIRHKNKLINGAQPYALLISGMDGRAYPASAPAGTSRSRISKLSFGTIQNTSPDNCGVYSDYTALSTHVEPGKAMPLTLTLQNCGPDPVEKVAKVFVDWNEDGDFEEEGENVLTTPVASGPATFTTNITTPAFVRVGSGTRLRVVLAETGEAALVTAGSLYGGGETEDYTLRFVRQIRDVGISGLAIPTAATLWANPAQSLSVKIKNFDALPQAGIPVAVTVKSGATVVATFTGTFPGTLDPLQEALFTLPGTFAVSPATTYEFTATTTLAGDQRPANNTFRTALSSPDLSPGPAITALVCAENPQASLKGNGNGVISWFDAAQSGTLLGLGAEIFTSFKPIDHTYYAALNDYAGTTLALPAIAAASISRLENDTIYLNARAAVVLDRVSIHTGVAGPATIQLLRPDGTLVDSVQLNLLPGRAEYGLNLVIPAAAHNYRLMISRFYQGATASHYPGAAIPADPDTTLSLLTFTGSASGGLYLFNLKFRAAGSPSARVSIKANGLLKASQPAACAGASTGTLTLTRFHGTIVRWEKSTGDSTWTRIDHTLPAMPFPVLTAPTRFRVVLQQPGCAAVYSDPVAIPVHPAPAAGITAPDGTVLCPGTPLPLLASGGKRYWWSTGDTSRQIQVSQPGLYSVEVTNEFGCSVSDSLRITARPVAWTGQVDSDWFNAANWNCQVPDSTVDVHIPAGLTHYPSIGTGVATCRNLVIEGALALQGGDLKMKGDFTNKGTFTHPGGTVELAGTGNHQLGGGAFQHLTLKSPDGTTLQSDITVNGTLQVANGIIRTGNHQITLGPDAVLMETEAHYITGKVATTRTFDQVQTSHSFGGLGLAISTTAAPGAIEVVRTTGVAPGITAIQRSFRIRVLPPGINDSLNATLDFYYFSHELNHLDKEFLALFRSTDGGATWMVQENSVVDTTPGVNKVTLAGIPAFSDWTLASSFSNETLPVNLVSFRALRNQADVILTWETGMEVHHAGMAIEVSGDARHYRQLHFVPATGTKTVSRQQYRYVDKEAGKTNIRYYRLKQVDLDGSYTYYGPRAVSFGQPLPGLQVYPNPSDGRLDLLAPAAAAGPLLLEVKNAAGQTVYVNQKPLQAGMNFLQLDLRSILKPGLYLLLGRYDNQVYPRKLLIR